MVGREILVQLQNAQPALRPLDATRSTLGAGMSEHGTRYRHHKGGMYRLVSWGQIEATGDQVVIYRSESDGKVWVRPRDEFYGTVHGELPGGIATRISRFERVKEQP